MITTTHMTLGDFCSSTSAMRLGIRDSINSETVPMVPASIIKTLKSMALPRLCTGTMPETRKTTPLVTATQGRYLGSAIIST